MDGRRCFGFLVGFLLISVAVGVRDAAAVGGLRVLMAEKEGERSGSGQEATAAPVEGGRSSPSLVSKNSPPPGNSSVSLPASRAPPNPPAAPHKSSPSTPVSGNSSNPAPAAGNLSVPVSGSPSHPTTGPGGSVNSPPSSSGIPLDRPPPSGSPPRTSPASDGRLSPPPVSGDHPAQPEAKLPKPTPSEHGRERPTNGKDGKEKEKEKRPGTSSNSDGSHGKGQETERCNVTMPFGCDVEGLVACLRQSQNEAQKWFLLVQNDGKSPLKMNILAPSSVKIDKTVLLPQHGRSKIEFHVDGAEGQSIVLNAGNISCTLHMPQAPSFVGNFFHQFPNYANHVTPIYGVYLASLTVIFVGGAWVCCRLRKRRVDTGVAYQQLEMGTLQQTSTLVDEDVMDGWDNGWNDDWDEEEAAPRPPEKWESSSQNGVAFKSSDKNEWEDWDD